VEGPIRVKELGDMTLEIPVAQSVRNENRLSSKDNLEILCSFPRKVMNTKVGGNFVPHYQNTKFALFGVWTWEI
jgi:predicted PolB exonuclease-like 3'-5' exonuclease